ncbi:MAG: ankyrin repeat domain-containing protein [Francisellaceae bacterium]|nr:ankyrin repeat domain-containing protein [Francisellaceae bacterium]
MTIISASEFTNPIMKRIANGDESVFLDSSYDPELAENIDGKIWTQSSIARHNNHPNISSRIFTCDLICRDIEDGKYLNALRVAAEAGFLVLVDKILKIPQIFSNTSALEKSDALRHASQNGHINVVNKLLEISAIFSNAANNNNYALRYAAKNGHLDVVEKLLEIPMIFDNAIAFDNYSLIESARSGNLDIVNTLLEIPEVFANAATKNNAALILAAANGHLSVVNRLLEIPQVSDNVSNNDSWALQLSAQGGHSEIAYILAKLQWPKGKTEMPEHLYEYLPEIYQGALIISGKKEFKQVIKCWVQGKPTQSTTQIHSPQKNKSSNNFVHIDQYNAPNFIMQYAGGCSSISNEIAKDIQLEQYLSSLLYSSYLHKTFQYAYKRGQKENKKHNGYNKGAMVEHSGIRKTRLII